MKPVRWILCATLACMPLVVGAQTAKPDAVGARNEAGRIDLVAGAVTVVGADQKQRAPKKGEILFEGDSVVTHANGELHVELTDGGVLAVRPNTAIRITKYQANGEASDTSIFGLLKGSMRSITGWIGKTSPANYKIITPTATMGVRGTDHEPTVIPEGATEGAPGTYDRVHAGASFIESKNGRVEVAQGRAGFFAAHGRDRPRVLDKVPTFFRPARNDARLAGRHAAIAATHEQRRAARVKLVTERRATADARARSRQEGARQGGPRAEAARPDVPRQAMPAEDAARRAAPRAQRSDIDAGKQAQSPEREKSAQREQRRQEETQSARQEQQRARQEQQKARQEHEPHGPHGGTK